ncbi:hypothetical protein, partial [Okeania sp. SIO2G5]|uniref:hypothetical protein n=1 Tax=Okeania sp. SIO2G5 TaxID=2607796 RepID=UPI0013BED211
MTNQLDKSFAFVVQDGSLERTFFLETDNGIPVKIGDGTYGVVFSCFDEYDDPYALKIFYEPDQGTHLAKQRFLDEIEASRMIHKELKAKTNERTAVKYVGVIKVVGGADKFKESLAFKGFEEYFNKLGISEFILVTPRFERTLKQLLEENHTYFTIASSSSETQIYGVHQNNIPAYKNRDRLDKYIEDLV